jgi:hypothetical protein
MQINVIPKNGLANRLRAMASGHLLAKSLGISSGLYWKTENILPANLYDLFDSRALSNAFQSIGEYASKFRDEDFAALVKVDPKSKSVFVNSRRIGEIALLPSILQIMDFALKDTQIYFYAGGLFHDCAQAHCLDCKAFRSQRQQFYTEITNGTECEHEALNFLNSNFHEYVAVHLRSTEMQNHQVSNDSLCRAILNLPQVASNKTQSVFISGDDMTKIEKFARLVEAIGLVPFWRETANLHRFQVPGTRDALIDLILLSKSLAIVRSGPTTFSYEAAVLGGIFDTSIHLNRTAKVVGVDGGHSRQKLHVT